MGRSKIRKALGAVKDKTSIGLAKVGNSSAVSELDVAIVKTTRHDEYPAEEKHIREILSLTSYSRSYISSCVSTISRRLGKTRSWTVALKTLALVHRLLTDGDPAYEQEIFFATRQGTRMLNMSDFRDTSRSDAWDFSAFVRTYALYLDERLDFRMHGRRVRRKSRSVSEEDEPLATEAAAVNSRATPIPEISTDRLFVRTQHLQQLLERFLACRPTGAARNNRLVAVSLYPLVKESAQIYLDLQEVMSIFIDRFMELEVPECVRVYDIFCRLAKQFDELEHFYTWCKTAGVSRPSEFPDIERITPKKLDVMDEFIREKSAMVSSQIKPLELEHKKEEDPPKPVVDDEADNSFKALPAPPEAAHVEDLTEEEEATVEVEEPKLNVEVTEEVDFLNLSAGAESREDQGDKLALALFDGEPAAPAASGTPPWEAFKEDAENWELALVQSASNLSAQNPDLPGGFDMALLNGMYTQPRPAAQGLAGNGSASSVVIPASSTQQLLALPAPPGAAPVTASGDPFAASLAVLPPPYVQMTDMEKKQQLLVEEQVMWQQYTRDRMQGIAGMQPQQQQQQQQQHNGQYYQGYTARF